MQIKLSSLSLLLSSTTTTAPVSHRVFQALEDHLRDFHEQPDAEFRGQFVKTMKDFFVRLDASDRASRKALRVASVSHNDSASPQQVSASEKFLWWYFLFLLNNIKPGSSYACTISSLQILRHLMQLENFMNTKLCPGTCPPNKSMATRRNGKSWDVSYPYNCCAMVNILLHSLFHPYDDVRTLVCELLLHASFQNCLRQADLLGYLDSAYKRLLTTGRLSDIEGFSRLCSLIIRNSAKAVLSSKRPYSHLIDIPKRPSAYDIVLWLHRSLKRSIELVKEVGVYDSFGRQSVFGLLSAMRYDNVPLGCVTDDNFHIDMFWK